MACFRVRGTECDSVCTGPFEGGRHYLHDLHHSLASGQATGREHSPAHLQKIELKIYWEWPVVLEKTLESPLDCKEIQPVHPKGNQSWIFIGRTDAGAETLILWPPDSKNWLIGKDPDAGEELKVGGEGDDGGWDGWMASPTQRTWVSVNSGSWWWTGKHGML